LEASRRRLDRAIGIVVGVLLGIAIVVVFVFYGSGDTIDAPSIDDDTPAAEREAQRGEDP
jgi:FlaG/FlaF family flagellin (archaellin)